MTGYMKRGVVFFTLFVLISGCAREKMINTQRTVSVKAFIKTEQFLLRTDSLFPNGLMKNVEIYDEPSFRSEVGFHLADSAKWSEVPSDTLFSNLNVYHGVIFGTDSAGEHSMSYEKMTHYSLRRVGITLVKDKNIDAVIVANGISCTKEGIILHEGRWLKNPLSPDSINSIFRFEKYNSTKALEEEGAFVKK
jgi:hypothetical protein